MSTGQKTLSGSFDDLLGMLQQQHDNNKIDIYLPSKGESVASKKITVQQQSEILTGALKQETRGNVFSYNSCITEIILKNCADPEEISLLDKYPVILQLRVDTLGEHIEINEETYNLHDHITRSLTGHVDTIDDLSTIHNHTTDTGITVTYRCPPLYIDYDINKSAESRWSKIDTEDIISELFKVEMCKYIKSVEIEEAVLDFDELEFDQKIQICNTLPMSLTNVIVTFMEEVKSVESVFLSLSGAQIPMNASLFGS